MNRKALLIEAGKARGQQALPGPAIDVDRLRTWFLSNDGGAWEGSEINTLSNPSSSDVSAAVRTVVDPKF